MIVDVIAPILEIDGSNVSILGLSSKQRTFREISRTDYMICSWSNLAGHLATAIHASFIVIYALLIQQISICTYAQTATELGEKVLKTMTVTDAKRFKQVAESLKRDLSVRSTLEKLNMMSRKMIIYFQLFSSTKKL